ncbi:MAG: N-acetyltransferase [Pseudomonadota bacterium]
MGAGPYTVTFLEMTAPPRRAPPPQPFVPGGGSLALLRAERPPVHFFLYLYATVGAEYEWTDRLREPRDQVAAFVQDPAVELNVLYHAGSPAGFYQLDFREAGVCDLAYFGLMPEAVGLKLGPWLLGTAIHDAWSPPESTPGRTAAPIEKLTVNTCTLDHPAALPLYQRMGFNPVRREEHVRSE